MRFEARIGEHGEITIPDDLISEFDLHENSRVDVQLMPLPERDDSPIDWDAIEKFREKLREPMLAQMRADGYHSVDEYIADIRGRDDHCR